MTIIGRILDLLFTGDTNFRRAEAIAKIDHISSLSKRISEKQDEIEKIIHKYVDPYSEDLSPAILDAQDSARLIRLTSEQDNLRFRLHGRAFEIGVIQKDFMYMTAFGPKKLKLTI